MVITSPVAAMGVRTGMMRVAAGTHQTDRAQHLGGAGEFSAGRQYSFGHLLEVGCRCQQFAPPTRRNANANRDDTIHTVIFMATPCR
jgi:hypothetical protein